MSELEGGGASWGVVCSAAVAGLLRQLQDQASRSGQGDEFILSFRQIVERLHFDPTEAGEPSYRLPALRMQIRTVAVRPLFLHYGVCEDRPLVFIKGAALLTR